MGRTSLEDTIREKAKNCNNTHFLIVDGMSNFLNQKVEKLSSSTFQAFGIEWYFQICSDKHDDYLSFFLRIASDSKVKCCYKLSIVSQTEESDTFEPLSNMFFDGKDDSWGHGEFLSHEVSRKKHIVNDKAVFYVEITNVTPKSTFTLTKGTSERIKLTEVPKKNSRFSWKITRFSSFTGQSHSSYEFTVGQVRWKLEMYPKGDTDGDGHLSLFLTASDYERNSSKPATTAVYKLRVLDQLKLNHKEKKMGGTRFSYPDASWGVSNLLPLKELYNTSRGFLVNDEIYVGVEFLFVCPNEIL